MPTIRQMYAGTYNFYKTAYQNGQIFRKSSNKNSAQNLNFSSMTSSAKDLLETYNTTKNTFNSEFDEKISALKNSAKNVKNFDFNVGENSVEKVEKIGENGEKIFETKYSEKMTDALKTVENFLSDYNDAINFFDENSSVSNRVKNLSMSFSDTKYFSKNYSEIGVEVAKDGTMKIDEEKLVDAINKNPQKVSRLMENLSNRAERKISSANSQKNNLFPSARQMLGKNYTSALYGKNNLINSYENVGNLINFMF